MCKINIYLLYVISFASGATNVGKQYHPTTSVPLSPPLMETTGTGCAYDSCTFLHEQYCLNDGACITDKSTCNAICACAEGYYGKRCQSKVGNASGISTPYNVTANNSRSACSGEVCIHGECVSAPFGTTSCQCNEGWFGTNCGIAGAVVDDDILNELSKTYPEMSLGIGNMNLPTDDAEHKQNDDETHPANNDISGVLLNGNDTSPENSTSIEVNGTVVKAVLNLRYNICSEDPIERNDEEKVCEASGGLKCVYGVCEETLTDHGSWKGYTTVCNCDPGARGTFCEHRCCLDCGENGKCDVHEDGDNVTIHCNCRHRYTGQFCEIYVPNPVSIHVKEDTWYLWIVGVCVGTFIILITLAVLGPYFMWKHRVILVMKIVHYFQAYEDDDEKEWDAFVSYRSHHIDEHFVVHVLYPKLEKELGFKLCLHFRDFVPGETISNNIINAVEGSRRTILILTPRYVESEFTRFEYQKAQTEMLKRKHRIIPIMLEDISGVTNIDKNLKGIINSVTYLEWPGSEDRTKKEDKFWKRLQLSLPKKKVNESEQKKPCTSVETSFNSQSKDISVSSQMESWFENSLKPNEKESNMKPATTHDCCEENIYSEIGAIDDNLRVTMQAMSKDTAQGDGFSDTVKPLSEEEELELICKGATQEQDNDVDTHTDYYVDMEHDRYIEFTLEDNPPSVSLTRKKLAGMYLQNDGYIEVDV